MKRPTRSYLRLPRRCGLPFAAAIITAVSLAYLATAYADDSDTFYGLYAGVSNTSGLDNSGFGYAALLANTIGNNNTAIGALSLLNNTTGNDNTAAGVFSLYLNSTGSENTSVGYDAMYDNTTGMYNTAIGSGALQSNNANANTATGYLALNHNTTGTQNTADGFEALVNATTAGNNTATGAYALFSTTTGSDNTADGAGALQSNTTGTQNTATGTGALYANTIGDSNTANGWNALLTNTAGGHNLADGYLALSHNTTGNNNTALGNNALLANTAGSSNIGVGNNGGALLTTGSNNIDIGSQGAAGEANTIRIGTKGTQIATFIAGIRGTTVSGGIAVMIDANGRLGTTTSSARFKDDIKPMATASEPILSLHPVTFRYKHELDPARIPQFGLVAEEVAKVDPDLVAYDEEGKPYTVRYDAVNAMLLNEFLKEHRKVVEQEQVNQKQVNINNQLKAALAEEEEKITVLSTLLRHPTSSASLTRVNSKVTLASYEKGE